MRGRRVVRVVTAVLGAVMVGVATLFKPKVKPDDHWSTPPTMPIDADAASEAAGGSV
ncbi:MAG TPA: hypothetical protein VFV00_18480 [Acidimicrobiales bacterium]|nr:hypothetical protein [Acidimicrobiales bacterium]